MGIIINVALCEGRHEISQATDGCVYGSIADITDIAKLEEEAVAFIRSHLVCGDTGDTCPCMGSKGLCDEQTRNLGQKVTLWHFNKETRKYFPQEVL